MPRSGREPTPEELAKTEPIERIELDLVDEPVRRSRLPLVIALALLIVLATLAAAAL